MPSLVDFRKGFGGLIAALAVGALAISGLLTFGSNGSFKFSNGVPNGVVFLDGGQSATTSAGLRYSTSTDTLTVIGTVTSSKLIVGNGAGTDGLVGIGTTTSSVTAVIIKASGTTNKRGLVISNTGAGTTGIIVDQAGSAGNISFGDNASGGSFAQTSLNRSQQFNVLNQAYDTNPYDFSFSSDSTPGKVLHKWVGSSAQIADLLDIFNNTASSTPVFAISAQGKMAIGVGASTSTNVMLDINIGTTATTTMSLGDTNTPGCIIIGDTDGGGVTYITALNGTVIGSTTDCR
jgi:hypothetical protein